MWEEPSTADYVVRSTIEWVGIVMAWLTTLLFAAGSILVALRSGRPGGYWMLSGVAAFFGMLLYEMTHMHTLGLRLEYSVTYVLREYIGPTLPFFLFAVGFGRLAWSLRHGSAVSDQE